MIKTHIQQAENKVEKFPLLVRGTGKEHSASRDTIFIITCVENMSGYGHGVCIATADPTWDIGERSNMIIMSLVEPLDPSEVVTLSNV